MAAEIKFYANVKVDDSVSEIYHNAGSGIGFYGSSFGVSVPVDSQQSTTFTTNADGTSEGIQLHNTKYATTGTVSIDSATAINLDSLPNYLCPLNIRFTNDDPVKVQNCKLRIFDRNNIENQASGVTTYVYEARHPLTTQVASGLSFKGRASDTWYEYDPVDAMSTMTFTSSPGVSGLNTDSGDDDPVKGYTTTSGVSLASTRHDWFVALSAEPQSIGSKTNYGLYFSVEYL
jgi:hypothetical protein